MERKADRNAPGEEGEEVQSTKKKVIREESQETQEYVRESLNLSRDEAEEVSFVPSAIRIPQKPMFWCDSRCSEKALRFWQFASVVVREGEDSCTANLCQQCYDNNLMAKGDAPFTKWQWYAVGRKGIMEGLRNFIEVDNTVPWTWAI